MGAVNLGPGRQSASQDSPYGVSRIGGQAGTQAPDTTPVTSQNRGSRAGSTIHSLPAEYDDLRASGEAFAAALALAGVDVRQVQIKTMLHGFLNLPGNIEPVSDALDLIGDTVGAARPAMRR